MRNIGPLLTVGKLVLMLLGNSGILWAQAGISQGAPCFSIHVRLNGNSIDGPKAITVRTPQNENTVAINGNCFTVPPALLAEKKIDVIFVIPRNRVYLAAINSGFFAGPWDVELEDKKFERGVVLPKHARIKEVCAVVFHVGDPETALSQTGCRTPQDK